MVRGDKQGFGKDYYVKLNNMKVNLIMASIREVSSRHGDVPSAYPKAQTEEKFEIHLQISQGMIISRDRMDELGTRCTRELLLKLQRKLYGLKQAGYTE